MISVIPILLSDLKPYMETAFDGDNELWEKYHNADDNFEDTVKNNIVNIEKMSSSKMTKCYKVEYRGKAIGFSVIVDDGLLYSFGINKYYRNKEIVLKWLSLIKEIANDFIVILCNENTRAIKFFERNGMYEVNKNNSVTTLIQL